VPGYTVERALGQGGDAEVWAGRRRITGERVALKVLHPRAPGAGEAARREAALLAAVDHPHVLRILELVEVGSALVLVLPLAEGGDLGRLVRARGVLEPGEVVTACAPVAQALASVHQRGLVHGDVTPSNILLTAEGLPLLADLGVARIAGEQPDEVGATAGYAAPEVVAGHAPGPAADVYGLATVAVLALTGRLPTRPFGLPGIAPATAGALGRALDHDPHRRPTAATLASTLFAMAAPEAIVLVPAGQHDGGAPAEPGPADADGSHRARHGARRSRSEGADEPPPPRGGRRRRRTGSTAAAAGAAAGVAGSAAAPPGASPPPTPPPRAGGSRHGRRTAHRESSSEPVDDPSTSTLPGVDESRAPRSDLPSRSGTPDPPPLPKRRDPPVPPPFPVRAEPPPPAEPARARVESPPPAEPARARVEPPPPVRAEPPPRVEPPPPLVRAEPPPRVEPPPPPVPAWPPPAPVEEDQAALPVRDQASQAPPFAPAWDEPPAGDLARTSRRARRSDGAGGGGEPPDRRGRRAPAEPAEPRRRYSRVDIGRLALLLAVPVILVGAVLVGLQWAGNSEPEGPPPLPPPSPQPTAADSAQAAEEVCGGPVPAPGEAPPAVEDWTPVLQELYAQRSVAFETLDPSLLCDVYVPASTGLAADVELIRDYAEAGVRPADIAFTVLSTEIVDQTGARVSLLVTDELPPYDLIDSDREVVGEQPGLPRESWEAEMLPSADGTSWRFG
jgi:eukaryotic-like serine/threonine-protein kinase